MYLGPIQGNRPAQAAELLLALTALALALAAATAIRYASVPLESTDLVNFRIWYRFIADNGHFAALLELRAQRFDYNVPYLYLLAVVGAALPSLDPTIAVKAISITFDYALAFFVYKCVGVKSNSRIVPLLAALATLMAPTVLTNSSLYGQCDAIFTTFLVACLYFLLVGRQAWAFVAFGLALSFKLQALFLAPLFLWLLMKRACDWRCFLLVPAVFLVALVPAWLVGRTLLSLLTIYVRQANKPTDLHSGLPNLWAWVPDSLYQWWPLGVVFAACVVLLVAIAIRRSSVKMNSELIVFLATYSALMMPYILPKMHQRYFFPAEVVGIVLAFYLPRYWFVPVIVGGVSFSTYLEELFWFKFVAIELRALVVLGILAILTWQLLAILAGRRVLSVRQLLVSLAMLSLVVGSMWLTGDTSDTRVNDDSFSATPVEINRTLREKLLHYRDYATATIQTALPRVWPLGTGTLQPHARYQAAYERIVAGDAGEPLIQSVFDVYRDGKTLIYVKQPCSSGDIREYILLGFSPLDRGSVTWPFRLRRRGVMEGDLCIAIVSLPYFEVEHMRTGQYRTVNGRPVADFPWDEEHIISTWERPATFEANPHYQTVYEQVVAGDFGEPVIQSLFDVYRDGKTLIYVKRPCSMDDIQAPFRLGWTHSAGSAGTTVSGRSFYFTMRGVMEGDICIAMVQLPDYTIEHMGTGQQYPSDSSFIWRMESTL